MEEDKINNLRKNLEQLYKGKQKELLFHGWHHIYFVSKKAKEFAKSIDANVDLTETAALVHDLNYIVEPNSEPESGQNMRAQILKESGYSSKEIENVEKIILEAHTANRGTNISDEGKALSDADTLFKALPITPILFASKYISQNRVDIYKLSEKVISEQKPLSDQDIYFYTDLAKKKYQKWAEVNLELWSNVQDALDDTDVKEMLSIAKNNGTI